MEGSRMKYRIALAVSLFALSAGSYATTLCQEKEQNILKEISYAEKHQNQNRIDGLNKALSEVRANCSDSLVDSLVAYESRGRGFDLAGRFIVVVENLDSSQLNIVIGIWGG